MKLVCIYQVILPYRVGVYERLGNSSKFDIVWEIMCWYKKSKLFRPFKL